MKAFRTTLQPEKAGFDIRHTDRILCMGSCFAENMGVRLITSKFTAFVNPYGVLFNPYSICKGLHLLADEYVFSEKDVFFYRDLWHSFMHHERFSKPTAEEALTAINRLEGKNTFFTNAIDYIFITLGTAKGYVEKENGEIVANCHKLPADFFETRRLKPAEITDLFLKVFTKLKKCYPSVRFILTVSPVRHIRDGLMESQRSKAILRAAVGDVCDVYPDAYYFPAYEIMMDDLRDYRFYEADMIHPNPVALDHIWDFFSQTFFSDDTRNVIDRVEKIQQAVRHRPFHSDSEAHQLFVRQTLHKMDVLRDRYQWLDFQKEEEILKRRTPIEEE